MKIENPIPDTMEEWLQEISEAYLDAKDSIPFRRGKMAEDDLFQLAPMVCMKFRGIGKSRQVLKSATDAALSIYIDTEDNKNMLSSPSLTFALSYLASHFGLELLDQKQVNDIMENIEREREVLQQMISLHEKS